MAMDKFGVGQRRKFTTLVVGPTTYTYGTNFVCEYIDIDPYPTDRRSKQVLGGRNYHYNVTADGCKITARVKLNNDGSTTSAYNLHAAITSGQYNRSTDNSVVVADYDDSGTVIESYTSHSDSRVIITAGPVSREAGCIYFDMFIDVDTITIAESV